MTSRSAAPSAFTATGSPRASRSTSEQVASKPSAAHGLRSGPGDGLAHRGADSRQMSSPDCSTRSGSGRQRRIGRAAWPPVAVEVEHAGRALAVPHRCRRPHRSPGRRWRRRVDVVIFASRSSGSVSRPAPTGDERCLDIVFRGPMEAILVGGQARSYGAPFKRRRSEHRGIRCCRSSGRSISSLCP